MNLPLNRACMASLIIHRVARCVRTDLYPGSPTQRLYKYNRSLSPPPLPAYRRVCIFLLLYPQFFSSFFAFFFIPPPAYLHVCVCVCVYTPNTRDARSSSSPFPPLPRFVFMTIAKPSAPPPARASANGDRSFFLFYVFYRRNSVVIFMTIHARRPLRRHATKYC